MAHPYAPIPVIAAKDGAPTGSAMAPILEALAGGNLVGLPGESAYWWVAGAHREDAVGALLGCGPKEALEPATLLEPDAKAPGGDRPLAPLLGRLARKFWPGPLVVNWEGIDPRAQGAAVRGFTRHGAVAHPWTAAVVSGAPFPLLGREARGPDGALVVGPEALLSAPGPLALLVDGGPARLGEPAAVLELGRGRFALVREGLVAADALRRVAGLRIGFVCTGNTCRSPMAEAIAKQLLAARLGSRDLARFGFQVSSSGIAAGIGDPAAGHAVALMAARGGDLGSHRSRRSIPEEILAMDRVYCLTRSHREALVQTLPPGRAKHVELLDPTGRDVPDPVGGSRADYERCAAHLEAAIESRAADWA